VFEDPLDLLDPDFLFRDDVEANFRKYFKVEGEES